MSWPGWHAAAAPSLTGVVPTASIQPTMLPTAVNSAPSVIPATGAAAVASGAVQYSPEQWAQMQQQNWQQWAQWQQQYQQWHQQYGAEYQKSLSALSAAANTNTSVPPPPPNENKPPPPPPPDEPTQFNAAQPQTSGYNTGPPPTQYTSRPPPTTQYNTGRNDWQNSNSKRPLLQNPESELANKRQMMENNWNRQTQPAKPSGASWQSQPPPQAIPATTTHAQKVLNLEELTVAEKKFDKEFAAWEAQFNKWKEQNVNHPDKTQYLEYEKKWESWRNSLLDRREQMRKKRLALQASMGKPPVSTPVQQPPPTQPLTQPPPQNFSQPPPLLGSSFNKQAETRPENLFSKPPPTQNNEPLSFKPPVCAPSPKPQNQNEPVEAGNSFLKSSSPAPGGIPGLDLVKEGVDQNDLEDNPPDSQEASPPVPKGPDLDAISKGLNSILGDANLLNMLSMVTQKQTTVPPAPVIDTSQPPPKPAPLIPSLMSINRDVNTQRSSQSFEDYSETYHPGGHFESVNNFDDQTRMSFTNGPTDQEMSYDGGTVTDPPTRSAVFNDFQRGDGRQAFGGGKPNGNYRFPRNNSFESQFHNANGKGRNVAPRNDQSFTQPYGHNQNVDRYNSTEMNEEQWNEEDEYEKYHSMFNEGDHVVEDHNDEVEPEPPVDDEPLFVPEVVVDYEHKPLREPIPEVSLDIIRKFDYRHKPVNRIPYPQRPIWLSSALRNIQQFDPLGTTRFTSINDRELPRYPPERLDQFSRWEKPDFNDDSRYERPKERYHEPRTESRGSDGQWDRRPTFTRNRHPPKNEEPGEDAARFEKKLDLEELSDEEWQEEKDSGGKKILRFSPPVRPLDLQPPNEARSFSGNEERKFTGNRPAPLPVKNVTMEDLINPPGRFSRPAKIVIILRGPPGSGKTYLAKLIKDREVENGGSAPRILSLDDYFMVEHEKEIIEDGKRVKVKEMKYEYEAEMEESYRQSLIKSFRKTITDGYFPFVVVDNVNQKVRNFGEMWSFAKQNGFQVYICQLDLDPELCSRQNIHHRTESYIEDCIAGWEPTPSHHPMVDASTFLHSSGPISEVEMEEVDQGYQEDDTIKEEQNRSKWDTFDCSLNNLARLDGLSKPLRQSRTMEEYLQMDAEWQEPDKPSKPGQKRVRWADLEEQKQQKKMKALGFVVGQTDWNRLMDPTHGSSALTQTKYIESRYQ